MIAYWRLWGDICIPDYYNSSLQIFCQLEPSFGIQFCCFIPRWVYVSPCSSYIWGSFCISRGISHCPSTLSCSQLHYWVTMASMIAGLGLLRPRNYHQIPRIVVNSDRIHKAQIRVVDLESAVFTRLEQNTTRVVTWECNHKLKTSSAPWWWDM